MKSKKILHKSHIICTKQLSMIVICPLLPVLPHMKRPV